VHPDLRVTWSRPTACEDEVRRQLTAVLALEDDLAALWDACDRVPELRRARPAGAGRVLRAPTAFEDLVGTLAATNASYAASRRMVTALVDGAFPAPEALARHGEDGLRARGWGYRAAALHHLATAVADGGLDVERWRDASVPDDEVLAGLRALPGFGPFAAATALPLLGHRPRPVVLDGWLRRQAPEPQAYAAMGRWAGTGIWLAVTARRW
jgi:N-glycosylase/DNA lyase